MRRGELCPKWTLRYTSFGSFLFLFLLKLCPGSYERFTSLCVSSAILLEAECGLNVFGCACLTQELPAPVGLTHHTDDENDMFFFVCVS